LNPILEGLTLSIIGLIVAFAFMALFILTIVLLKALFPAKASQPETAPELELPAPAVAAASEAAPEVDESEVAAAIAVAVAYVRSKTQSSLGNTLAEGRGAWWMANRINAPQDSGLNKR
jgi:sodium pump decarboxylase gamma subunit